MRNNSSNALIESYSYDAFHNRKQRSAGASTDYYVYDSAQQLLEIRATTATGSLNKAFVYDSVGNMTRTCEGGTVTRSASACSGTTSLTLGYNNLNQLSTASKTGLASESYRYDGLGNRIEKVVGSSPQRFVYNGATIFTEYSASWTTAQASHVLGGLDIPLMRAKAIGQGDYYHPDGMGSIVISTNEADTITGKRVYNAWGTVSTSSGSVATYGFVGREADATGLIYLRARYYDPDTGRFTQADPLGFIDGINRYTYAKNSPVNFVDPWGTTAREPSGWIDATQNYFSNNPDELVSLGLGFTPAGVLLDLGTLLTGRDVITGEAVPWYWATLGMIPSVSEIRKASNAVNTVSDIAEVAAKLPGPASGIVGDAVKSGNIVWPPNRGFDGDAAPASLVPGTKVDRYGSPNGTFVAPEGTPFPMRSLPESSASKPLTNYEVIKPIEVNAGPAAPWFNQPGGGMQYELPKTVQELIESGHLR